MICSGRSSNIAGLPNSTDDFRNGSSSAIWGPGRALPITPKKRKYRARSEVSASGLGCVKTRTDLVILPSGGRIFAFFCSERDHKPQNPGCRHTA
jgi:hypothetical protein